MVCKKCNSENVDWASYCTQCGEPMGWICRCSFVNRKSDNFCGGCGKLLQKNTGNSSLPSPQNEKANSNVYQYSEKQIKSLIKESILFKVGKKEKINQTDIDSFFADD